MIFGDDPAKSQIRIHVRIRDVMNHLTHRPSTVAVRSVELLVGETFDRARAALADRLRSGRSWRCVDQLWTFFALVPEAPPGPEAGARPKNLPTVTGREIGPEGISLR